MCNQTKFGIKLICCVPLRHQCVLFIKSKQKKIMKIFFQPKHKKILISFVFFYYSYVFSGLWKIIRLSHTLPNQLKKLGEFQI